MPAIVYDSSNRQWKRRGIYGDHAVYYNDSGNELGRDSMAAAAVAVPLIEILIAVFGNLFIHPLASLLGSTPQIHGEATEYIHYIVSFSPFLIFSFLLSGLVFSVLIMLPHFLLKKGNLYFAIPRLPLPTVRNIFTLGFPSFIMEFTIGIITFVYNIAIVTYGYGEIGLAAYLLIGYLMLIILTLFLGMAEGLQPVFSYFAGSNEVARCNDMRRFAAKIFLSAGVVCYILIVLFSRYFFSIFNPEDTELIAFTADKSLLYFCAFFLAEYNILMISFWQSTGRTFTLPPAAMADHAQAVYAEQSKVIWELAEKSDCVIVGRCADCVLWKLSPFRLFIYADMNYKVERCRQKGPEKEILSVQDLQRKILSVDKSRAKYYQFYTDQIWGEKKNYDLCINTSGIEIIKIIDAIECFLPFK